MLFCLSNLVLEQANERVRQWEIRSSCETTVVNFTDDLFFKFQHPSQLNVYVRIRKNRFPYLLVRLIISYFNYILHVNLSHFILIFFSFFRGTHQIQLELVYLLLCLLGSLENILVLIYMETTRQLFLELQLLHRILKMQQQQMVQLTLLRVTYKHRIAAINQAILVIYKLSILNGIQNISII